MNLWTWRLEAADGSELTGSELPASELSRASFPSQADAETWIGECWQELLAAGVEQASLLSGGQKIYGPMSLRPVE